jgi:hypothetical protein
MQEDILKEIRKEISTFREGLGFDLLEAALKRITYKGLQGGPIDKTEKIYASFYNEIKT